MFCFNMMESLLYRIIHASIMFDPIEHNAIQFEISHIEIANTFKTAGYTTNANTVVIFHLRYCFGVDWGAQGV